MNTLHPPTGPEAFHLIIGGGQIGYAAAEHLRECGQRAVIARRHPPGDASEGAHIALDALDAHAVGEAARGASHIHLTLGLPYRTRVWQRDWPRIVQGAIDAALAHGARLVWFDNLYAYGPLPLKVPMREDHTIDPPSRKGQVRAALLRMIERAGRKRGLRWLVARSADFYGPGVRQSLLHAVAMQRQAQGRAAWWLGDADRLHSFTYVPDAGRALATLALDDAAYQQSWHLPTASPATTPRELLTWSARLLGAPTQVVTPHYALLWGLGLVVPDLREVREMLYQNQQDYVFSSAKFEAHYPAFRITPYEEGIAAMARALRA